MAHPLGLAFSNLLMPGGARSAPAQPMPTGRNLSKGELIMGVLADALAGATGRQGAFAAQMGQQRKDEREMAQWGLQRKAGLEDFEAKQRIEQRYKVPEVSPMVRDATAWAGMTDAQRTAYGQMKQAGAGDPDVFVTLPNGQVYAGPRSGLQQALMGGAAPAVAPKPVGKLTPINGGQTPASGSFRP